MREEGEMGERGGRRGWEKQAEAAGKGRLGGEIGRLRAEEEDGGRRKEGEGVKEKEGKRCEERGRPGVLAREDS